MLHQIIPPPSSLFNLYMRNSNITLCVFNKDVRKRCKMSSSEWCNKVRQNIFSRWKGVNDEVTGKFIFKRTPSLFYREVIFIYVVKFTKHQSFRLPRNLSSEFSNYSLRPELCWIQWLMTRVKYCALDIPQWTINFDWYFSLIWSHQIVN